MRIRWRIHTATELSTSPLISESRRSHETSTNRSRVGLFGDKAEQHIEDAQEAKRIGFS